MSVIQGLEDVQMGVSNFVACWDHDGNRGGMGSKGEFSVGSHDPYHFLEKLLCKFVVAS